MNYYDELGVGPDADNEQIHRAYKTLARLIHPDGHVDEQIKAMAGRQMARLNEILATLTDAKRRCDYDRSLSADHSRGPDVMGPPASEAPMLWRRGAARAGWHKTAWHFRHALLFGAALLVLVAAAWHEIGDEWAPAGSALVEPAPPDKAQPQSISGSPGSSQRATETRPAPRQRASDGRPSYVPPRLSFEAATPAVPSSGTSPRATPDIAGAVPAPSPPAHVPEVKPPIGETVASKSFFSGNWFYSAGSGMKADSGTYPAQYIEFILAEDRGNITGHYRAQYRIPDKTILSEVSFQAHGRTDDGQTAKLFWTSKDGAKGEIELTLRAPNLLRMIWWTSQFGSRASLASGEAILVRQRDGQ